MVDFAPIGAVILANPVSAGIIAKLATDALKGVFKKADESGQLVQHKGAIQPIVYVLTILTAVLSAGMEGNSASVDPAPLVSFAVQMLLSAFGTNEALKGAKKAVVAVKEQVKK